MDGLVPHDQTVDGLGCGGGGLGHGELGATCGVVSVEQLPGVAQLAHRLIVGGGQVLGQHLCRVHRSEDAGLQCVQGFAAYVVSVVVKLCGAAGSVDARAVGQLFGTGQCGIDSGRDQAFTHGPVVGGRGHGQGVEPVVGGLGSEHLGRQGEVAAVVGGKQAAEDIGATHLKLSLSGGGGVERFGVPSGGSSEHARRRGRWQGHSAGMTHSPAMDAEPGAMAVAPPVSGL